MIIEMIGCRYFRDFFRRDGIRGVSEAMIPLELA
jgi:hypothetical protein